MSKKREEKTICCTCAAELESPDSAPVLSMGHYGMPRLICPKCEELINIAQTSRDPDEAEAAMARLGAIVSDTNKEDTCVHEAIEEIFAAASQRADAIRKGEYDFALDEAEEAGFDEIPEELLETEEDRALDKRDEEREKKFNKVFNWVTGIVFAAAAILIIVKIITSFLS
jgi:hypothetical protein